VTAKVQPLRPAAPARSPAREKLAEAIRAAREADAHVERVDLAWRKLGEDRWRRLDPALDRAKARLVEAKQGGPRRLVERLLNGMTGAADDSVAEAEAELAAAQRAVEEADKAAELLRAEAEAADRARDAARRNLRDAVNRVLATAPETTALLAAYRDARARAAVLAAALDEIGPVALPTGWDAEEIVEPGIGAERMRAAIAALHRDADAALPGLDTLDDPAPAVA